MVHNKHSIKSNITLSPSSSGLGPRPFTAVTGVRVPQGTPTYFSISGRGLFAVGLIGLLTLVAVITISLFLFLLAFSILAVIALPISAVLYYKRLKRKAYNNNI